MVGAEMLSSPQRGSNGFASLQEELDYYKTAYETLDAELQEFQSSSKELEAELERDVEESEKRERKLQEKVERLGFEAEEWKTKYKQSKTEANNAQNTLQKEITTLRDAQRSLQLRLRDMEVQNDDFERQTRNQTSSLEDIETKYNVAVEREVMLEEEIQIGEREREGLRIETQRLRDELSDLKIESEIRMEKLRLAEATIEKHHQRAVSNHLAKESHTLRPRSPFSEASTTNTNMSSPTAASTPPYSMQPDGLRPDSTPPSPPLSDAPLAIRPIPFNPPMPTRKLSIASRDPAATPRAGTFASRPRHTRLPSISAAPGAGASAGPRRTPSVMRPPSAHQNHSQSHAQRPSRPSIGNSASAGGLPRSGSLYQIRGLIGKMQKLEERVHSARSKLPAPMATPPRASPRPPSAASNYLPGSVSVRKRASQASTSASSVGEGANNTGVSRLSFGVPSNVPSTTSNSRPGSRASMSSTPQLSRAPSRPSPITRSSTTRTPGTRTPGVRTPSTRTPNTRNPLGHYSSASMSGRIGKAPPPILHLHEGRQFGRTSLNRHPSDQGNSHNVSRSDTGSDDESEIKTPIGRRATMERTGIPTPGSGSASALPRRTSVSRRISASMDGGMGPPARPRKMSTYEEETY
jgi:predicted  nucleic acid-binding Zn-ribbon protein